MKRVNVSLILPSVFIYGFGLGLLVGHADAFWYVALYIISAGLSLYVYWGWVFSGLRGASDQLEMHRQGTRGQTTHECGPDCVPESWRD